MLNLPSKLTDLASPINVGIIGAGFFGTKLATQVERVEGMHVTSIADIDVEAAEKTYEGIGVPKNKIKRTEKTASLNNILADGGRTITTDGEALARSEVDVLVEATGHPEAGARHAYTALSHGNEVVMVTDEADTDVGTELQSVATRNDATYSLAYGDQPALIIELCDWAETIGLEVVAAGKGVGSNAKHRYGTPDDVFERMGFDRAFVEGHELNPQMYNSFFDGTKVAVEMCSVANATGLKPDVSGMHLPTAGIPDIANELRPVEDGGCLENRGIVDTVYSLRPDGSEVDKNISHGVFVVTTTPDEGVREYFDQLRGSGLYVANDGKYQLFYRPHHLPGTETTVSIAYVALHGEPTGSASKRVSEVVGAAKRDLDADEEIDGGGGYTVYGRLEQAEEAKRERYVPLELLKGATLNTPVKRDEVITFDDVDIDEDSFCYRLRYGGLE